jgi:hypothetical protein
MKDFKQTTKMNAQGSHYKCGGKVKKLADGGGVQSYDEAKKTAPSGIRVPKEGEETNYSGYGWPGDSKEENAKKAKSYFDANIDGMKTKYNKFKQKGDPSESEIASGLGKADEASEGVMRRALNISDKQGDELYKLKREAGLKKGGKVKRGMKK